MTVFVPPINYLLWREANPLRRLREQKGYTLERLCDELSMDWRTLRSLEYGGRRSIQSTIKRIAVLFGKEPLEMQLQYLLWKEMRPIDVNGQSEAGYKDLDAIWSDERKEIRALVKSGALCGGYRNQHVHIKAMGERRYTQPIRKQFHKDGKILSYRSPYIGSRVCRVDGRQAKRRSYCIRLDSETA